MDCAALQSADESNCDRLRIQRRALARVPALPFLQAPAITSLKCAALSLSGSRSVPIHSVSSSWFSCVGSRALATGAWPNPCRREKLATGPGRSRDRLHEARPGLCVGHPCSLRLPGDGSQQRRVLKNGQYGDKYRSLLRSELSERGLGCRAADGACGASNRQ